MPSTHVSQNNVLSTDSIDVRQFIQSHIYVCFRVVMHNNKCFGALLYFAITQHRNVRHSSLTASRYGGE